MKSNLLMIGLKTDRRNEMRIIIAGSREYENQNEFTNIVNYIMTFDIFKTDESKEIISGHAHGADQLGEQFAKKMNYPIKLFIPNWKMYGKKAGHIRNKKNGIICYGETIWCINCILGRRKQRNKIYDSVCKRL